MKLVNRNMAFQRRLGGSIIVRKWRILKTLETINHNLSIYTEGIEWDSCFLFLFEMLLHGLAHELDFPQ